MSILIPFPSPPTAREDALAYWTPSAPVAPAREPRADTPMGALEQMYAYFVRN